MIAAFECHEACSGDACGHQPPFLERYHRVIAAMHDQRRHGYLLQKIADVDVIHSPPDADRILRRCGDSLQIVEPFHLLDGATRNEN